jgi:hypothetical protein
MGALTERHQRTARKEIPEGIDYKKSQSSLAPRPRQGAASPFSQQIPSAPIIPSPPFRLGLRPVLWAAPISSPGTLSLFCAIHGEMHRAMYVLLRSTPRIQV